MPSHAKNVKPYRENQPMLARYGIESQLDGMFSPVVQLRSGGYIVLNQTEALVAIDVNSGRATREHHIEDTALKTNIEASEEISRQLRLRDLAGLIVIDYIDMDEKRNNRSVERRLKECLKNDRARIQVGRISHFGLLEMSRQRIRTSVLESSTDKCPHCGGTGHVRSVSSVALQCLRMIEESLQRGATHNLTVRTRPDIALYVLNNKRTHLYELEKRYQITVTVSSDPGIAGQVPFVVEKGEQVHSSEQARALASAWASTVASLVEPVEEEFVEEPLEQESEGEAAETDNEAARGEEDAVATHEAAEEDADRGENGEEGGRGRRRRRRRRGGSVRRDDRAEVAAPGVADDAFAATASAEEDESTEANEEEAAGEEGAHEEVAGEHGGPGPAQDNGNGDRRRRRRGRRGGRRNRREEGDDRFTPPEHGASPIDEEVIEAAADFGGPPVERITNAVGEYAPAGAEAEPSREMSEVSEARISEAEVSETQISESRSRAPSPAPAPAATKGASSAPAAAETAAPPTRRRSTVREAVPFLVGGSAAPTAEASAPVPEAVESAPAQSTPVAPPSAEPAAPRRAGWWGKRIFGEKT
jgi:ribonuclease E